MEMNNSLQKPVAESPPNTNELATNSSNNKDNNIQRPKAKWKIVVLIIIALLGAYVAFILFKDRSYTGLNMHAIDSKLYTPGYYINSTFVVPSALNEHSLLVKKQGALYGLRTSDFRTFSLTSIDIWPDGQTDSIPLSNQILGCSESKQTCLIVEVIMRPATAGSQYTVPIKIISYNYATNTFGVFKEFVPSDFKKQADAIFEAGAKLSSPNDLAYWRSKNTILYKDIPLLDEIGSYQSHAYMVMHNETTLKPIMLNININTLQYEDNNPSYLPNNKTFIVYGVTDNMVLADGAIRKMLVSTSGIDLIYNTKLSHLRGGDIDTSKSYYDIKYNGKLLDSFHCYACSVFQAGEDENKFYFLAENGGGLQIGEINKK